MAGVKLELTNREQAFARMRVVCADTVEKRLTERAVPIALDLGPELAARAGIRRSPDTFTHPDGYSQIRRKPGPHYMDMFEATVERPGPEFPVILKVSNGHHAANIIENGRGASATSAAEGRQLLFPGQSGETVFTPATSNRSGTPAHNVIGETVRLAISRASR